MSALSASLSVALILGVSIVAGQLLRPTSGGNGGGIVRLLAPSHAASAIGRAISVPSAGSPRSHPFARGRPPRSDHAPPGSACCGRSAATDSSGSRTSVGVGVQVGPATAGAKVTAGWSGVMAGVDAGPVHESVTVNTKPVDDAVASAKKPVCQLTC
jgi:hypothetical protein